MSVAHAPIVGHGKVRWLCDPTHGAAHVRMESEGDPTPGELLAAAYSAFIANDLGERLELNGVPASEIIVHTWCRLSADVAPRSVQEFEINVQARVSGIDDERLRAVAGVALASCHTSLGMRRNLPTKLHAELAD